MKYQTIFDDSLDENWIENTTTGCQIIVGGGERVALESIIDAVKAQQQMPKQSRERLIQVVLQAFFLGLEEGI